MLKFELDLLQLGYIKLDQDKKGWYFKIPQQQHELSSTTGKLSYSYILCKNLPVDIMTDLYNGLSVDLNNSDLKNNIIVVGLEEPNKGPVLIQPKPNYMVRCNENGVIVQTGFCKTMVKKDFTSSSQDLMQRVLNSYSTLEILLAMKNPNIILTIYDK